MQNEITSIREFYAVLCKEKVLIRYEGDAWKDRKSFASDDGFFFRGQKAGYRKITTSLSRNENYIVNETRMYLETIQTKSEDLLAFNFPIEMLSKMQHYGLPTRLIDFSIDPLISLFFAVQNEEPDEFGAVYVFKRAPMEYNDLMPQVLSLLPLVDTSSADMIIEKYSEVFHKSIDKKNVKDNISGISFIKYSKKIEATNPRLHNQKGTFAICGNTLNDDGTISNSVSDLSVDEADISIHIAGAYKKHILDELKLYFDIDDNYIYPEFTAWTEYMKRKYGSSEYAIDSLYWIVNSQDSMLPDVSLRRISAILNNAAGTDDIKRAGKHIFKEVVDEHDAIEIRLYSSYDNYMARNWIAQCRWVSSNLDVKYQPFFVQNCDEVGLEWEFPYKLTASEVYYQDHVFKEPKLLFLSHHKCYKVLLELFYQLDTAYNILEENHTFSVEVMKRHHIIIQCCEKMFKFGRARDNNLDSYLCNYKDFASSLELICLVSKDYVQHRSRYFYIIGNLLLDCSQSVRNINRNKARWLESFNVNSSEVLFEHNEDAAYKELPFKQTIPVAQNAIDVQFDLSYSWVDNGDLLIECKTNLFNDAQIFISLEIKYDSLIGRKECFVEEQCFEAIFERNELSARHYTVEVAVPSSISQKRRRFLDLAGQEYQYLTGHFVNHAGIESRVVYREHFKICDDGTIAKTDSTDF